MNYIIVSKDRYKGTSGSDIKDPCSVTEIATELVITRLHLFNELAKNNISIYDTIVCIEDRKCLYTNIFHNVINFQEFTSLQLKEEDTVEDYLTPATFASLSAGEVSQRLIPYLPFYQNYVRDKYLIGNVDFSDLSNYDVSKPFVCLVIRKRGAWDEKNLHNDFWIKVIELLEKSNIKTFVFGKEVEYFCLTENTTFISNFRDWCTIVTHENCMHVASTMTGAVYPLLVFGNPDTKMTIVDNLQLMSVHGNDPSFYHPCINFSQIEIEFINRIPTPEEFYAAITRNFNL